MRALLYAGLATMFASPAVLADGTSLAGSLWLCSRASDGSQFVITFYPDGGVGGGELQDGEVSPYIFDASGTKGRRWPGRWEQKEQRFTWEFPDQNMTISGTVNLPGQRGATLTGTETASGTTSAVECRVQSKLPKIGQGLVIPRDSHFVDLDGEEGVLKAPAGISLQAGGSAHRTR